MTEFNYALPNESYTWRNALLWGNFSGHCELACKGTLGAYIVHIIIAALEFLPIIGQIASIFEKIIVTNCRTTQSLPIKNPPTPVPITVAPKPKETPVASLPVPAPAPPKPMPVPHVAVPTPPPSEEYLKAFDATPAFNFYRFELPPKHPCTRTVLTGVSHRPANLFFDELFKGSKIATNRPDDGLFTFNVPPEKVREHLEQLIKTDPNGKVTVTAKGKIGDVAGVAGKVTLSELYGEGSYEISYKELLQTLDSQRIYLSSMMSLPFYTGLKKAMLEDGIVELPGKNDFHPILMTELKGKMGEFLKAVRAKPELYGLTKDQCDKIFRMTLYQVGSMVVKSEDYRIFIDGKGKIIPRTADKNDAIRLLNACGIRGVNADRTPKDLNREIMTQTFRTAFQAAESGIMVFPAVGMGIWRGDPDLYWGAFLDALVESNINFDKIFVQPRHEITPKGHSKHYVGCDGNEFQTILNLYRKRLHDNPVAMAKLDKIYNLYDSRKDVVQLAHNLKQAFPGKIVSLFNASDPDVTLGYHVGEYVNNKPHGNTTEENYAALGTSLLNYERATNVHVVPGRVIQT